MAEVPMISWEKICHLTKSGETMKQGSSEATRSFTYELTIFRAFALINCDHFTTYEFRDKQFE